MRYLVVDGGHLLLGGWDAHEVVAEHAANLAIARLEKQVSWQAELLASSYLAVELIQFGVHRVEGRLPVQCRAYQVAEVSYRLVRWHILEVPFLSRLGVDDIERLMVHLHQN